MRPEGIAAAFRAACRAETRALKPGNVHIYADGHGMTVADFEASAEAAAPHIAAVGASVGERILRAVTATRERVGQNTNLGIILLCAPLGAAAEATPTSDLRGSLAAVLAALGTGDADACFRAIALANPGGLGTASDHDVRETARVTLREAMRHAAARDRIAYQYVSDFADIFDAGLPCAEAAASAGLDAAEAAARVYWHFLTRIPDSHIARKFGLAKAEEIRASAVAVGHRVGVASGADERRNLLLTFDAQLKGDGINPGTTADLTVATLFAHNLQINFV